MMTALPGAIGNVCAWRIGQKHPVRGVFFSYAGSSQITCLQLMAKKSATAQSTSGDVPESGLDSLIQDGDSMSDGFGTTVCYGMKYRPPTGGLYFISRREE